MSPRTNPSDDPKGVYAMLGIDHPPAAAESLDALGGTTPAADASEIGALLSGPVPDSTPASVEALLSGPGDPDPVPTPVAVESSATANLHRAVDDHDAPSSDPPLNLERRVDAMLSGTDDPPPADPPVPEPPAFSADIPAKDQRGSEYAAAVSEGRALVGRENATAWDVGDLILAVCGPPDGPGRKAAHASFPSVKEFAADIDLAYELAKERRLVAHVFPPGQRNLGVAWSVHRELARADLHEEEKHDTIKRQRWTLRSLSAHLASLTAPAPTVDDHPEPAPDTPSEPPPATAPHTLSAPTPVPPAPSALTGAHAPAEPAPSPRSASGPYAEALAALTADLEALRSLSVPADATPVLDEMDALVVRLRTALATSAPER